VWPDGERILAGWCIFVRKNGEIKKSARDRVKIYGRLSTDLSPNIFFRKPVDREMKSATNYRTGSS